MGKIILFPPLRMLTALLFVGAGILASQLLLNLLRWAFSIRNVGLTNLLAFILITPAAYCTYRVYVWQIEKRETAELEASGASAEFGFGALTGFGLIGTVMASLWLLGCYQVDGFNLVWISLIGTLAGVLASAFAQELIFRAVIYRISEEWLGTRWALIISMVLFGLIHLASSSATIFSTLTIALQAGIMLGAAYALTHRLWMALGLHTMWDFANDGIFGVGIRQSGQALPDYSMPT
jgi:membrane protease YdiL (CAAX protease family)